MITDEIIQKITNLSPKAQEEVYNFIEFVIYKYTIQPIVKETKKTPLEEEPFFGIWSDRPEMKNSVEYVKNLRENQWSIVRKN